MGGRLWFAAPGRAGLEIRWWYTIALVSAHEKDYLLAGQGNDAPKAPHHKSAEGI
jgi:hypothetical protein